VTDRSERQIEVTVQFLNVDVEVFGEFDRAALLKGFGDAIHLLHEGESRPGEPAISFELSTAMPTFPGVISELLTLIGALPADARAAWNHATRRVFSIGIQAGLHPRSTEWMLAGEMMAALVEVNADVALTLYGADLGA
jgi:hypothetical protein